MKQVHSVVVFAACLIVMTVGTVYLRNAYIDGQREREVIRHQQVNALIAESEHMKAELETKRNQRRLDEARALELQNPRWQSLGLPTSR